MYMARLQGGSYFTVAAGRHVFGFFQECLRKNWLEFIHFKEDGICASLWSCDKHFLVEQLSNFGWLRLNKLLSSFFLINKTSINIILSVSQMPHLPCGDDLAAFHHHCPFWQSVPAKTFVKKDRASCYIMSSSYGGQTWVKATVRNPLKCSWPFSPFSLMRKFTKLLSGLFMVYGVDGSMVYLECYWLFCKITSIKPFHGDFKERTWYITW